MTAIQYVGSGLVIVGLIDLLALTSKAASKESGSGGYGHLWLIAGVTIPAGCLLIFLGGAH